MARRDIAYQPVFTRGMLEGVEIDWNTQGTQASVALLLNFDHLRQDGALVKRDGWRLLWDSSTTNSYVDSPHLPGIKTNATYVAPGSSSLVELDLGDFCTTWKTHDATNDQNHILGIASARHSEIDSSNGSIVVFARFYNATNLDYIEGTQNGTMVIAYSKEQGQASRRWQSPFKNSYLNGVHPYPGWMSRGILTDWTRFGGTIIYATELNTAFVPVDTAKYRTGTELPTATPGISENMYPVYVWSLVDNGHKRDKGTEHFWSLKLATATTTGPLPLSDLTALYDADNKYKHMKVRYPSMWLTRNAVVGWREMDTSWDVAFQLMTSSIEVCIGEQKVRQYSTDPDKWYKTETQGGNTYYYAKLITQPEDYPVIANSTVAWINDDVSFTESLEMLDGYSYTMPDEHTVAYEALKGEQMRFEAKILTAKYSGKEYRLNVLAAQMSNAKDRLSGGGSPELAYDMRAPNDDADPGWNKVGHAVVGVRLPNYLANGNPRYWLKGEKIPLVLTAVVNGTEIKIADYTYVVKGDHYQPNPLLHAIAPDEIRTKSWNRWDIYGDPLGIKQTIYSRMFYGVYDSRIEDDGGAYLFPTAVLWMPEYRRTTGLVQDVIDNTKENAWPNYVAHCWEPWNPTQQAPFVPAAGEYAVGDPPYVYGGFYDLSNTTGNGATFDRIGHRPFACEGNIVWVTIRFKNDFLDTLYELGASKFNIYIAKASQEESLFQSLGLFTIQKSVPPSYYGKPVVDEWEDNPAQYGLLHSFVLDGKGKGFADVLDGDKWKNDYSGQPLEHQGWQWNETHMWPALVDEDGSLSADLPLGLSQGILTPDFYVWDYATDAPTLTLNSNAEYWQGRGAKCVEQVKGRVFIGGCIDEKGYEEPGMVRYSAVQRGVISLDVFNAADWVKFGASPIVALKEFREQLWVFNRQEMYRLQMPEITNIASWEILEKVAGQGTFAPMTVVATPYGVVWANENGLWISDGRAPENLATAILVQYQWMATLRPDPLVRHVQLPAVPIESGYNPYLNIDYDPVTDSIIVQTPTATPTSAPTTTTDSNPSLTAHELRGELRAIFDMQTKTWRIEQMDFPVFGAEVSRESPLFP